MYTSLFQKLQQIEEISTSRNCCESWTYLRFEGTYNPQNKSFFIELYDEFKHLALEKAIKFKIDKQIKSSFEEFIEEIQAEDIWYVNINKNIFFSNNQSGFSTNFFYSKEQLIIWASQTNPFDESYPFNSGKYKIIVNKLENDFGGINFVFCKKDNNFESLNWVDFDETLIESNVHVVSQSKLIIKPINHYISYGKTDEISSCFYKNSILILLSSLSNEVYDSGELILRGYRRIPIKIGLDYSGNDVNDKYQKLLGEAVKWIYQNTERCDLRLKLILERITLDIDYSLPYIQGLYTIIEESTIQAKERYSFIIYDRKDLYQKELKDLLKDIKSLTDSFSAKVRGLLSNLLRDVLAAFVLIGITIFSKVTEIENLFENKLVKYVFFAFGVYFLISGLLQLIIDSLDVNRSYIEFNYWKKITNEYMSKNDFKRHKEETINARLRGIIPSYIFVLLIYIGIAYFCFKLPEIWVFIFHK